MAFGIQIPTVSYIKSWSSMFNNRCLFQVIILGVEGRHFSIFCCRPSRFGPTRLPSQPQQRRTARKFLSTNFQRKRSTNLNCRRSKHYCRANFQGWISVRSQRRHVRRGWKGDHAHRAEHGREVLLLETGNKVQATRSRHPHKPEYHSGHPNTEHV